ncbi:hypothetical protein [Novosphingobium colocasiae]|uniref:hypothetical protein n=1 Tax=Novosphingobium colocasiae TaxID=1256513 RepID=UPI0035B42336
MADIALPPPPTARAGLIVTAENIAGAVLFTVTLWRGPGHPPRRNWFTDRAVALAAAAERADEFGLPMVDLTAEPGA